MSFEKDLFISYARRDNRPRIPGQKGGWISNLSYMLGQRLGELLGDDAKIWWDERLRGNVKLRDGLLVELSRVALLMPVVSPGYVKSEWCRKELDAFCRFARRHLKLGERWRIFKVVKTPVDRLDQPEPLRDLKYRHFVPTASP